MNQEPGAVVIDIPVRRDAEEWTGILRGETSGGSYELVGEATGATFSDVMLERDRRYYYVVQAYDASGVRSVYSAEANGLLPLFRVYLPLALRQ